MCNNKVAKESVEVVKPMACVLSRVSEIAEKIITDKQSGEIIIQFHEGVYQRSKAVITHKL